MPELPELEALVEALDPLVTRAPVAAVPTAHFAVVKTFAPPLDSLVGQRLTGARRRAKRLLFPAEGGTTLFVHLMSAGKVAFVEPGERRPGGAVLALEFADGAQLIVTEGGTRKRVRVALYDEEALAAELDGLGPEPLDPAFDRAALDAALRRGGQLSSLLRDQRAIAGIGRAYANEILHAARLSPFAPADRLDEAERERLYEAIGETLRRGIERFRAHGSRMPAKRTVAGLYDVHGRAGEPCPRCRGELRFVDYAEYQIVYCPACQTGGRVYADRRRSRLLR
jgi:formamidopyrimidine-DNA glycosylase